MDLKQISKRNARVSIVLVILIIILGAFLRFYQIGKLSFWLDEVITYKRLNGDLNTFLETLRTNANMRLFFVFAYIWMELFPNASEGILRILPAIFSVLTIPTIYMLGRKFGEDIKTGSMVGLIAAFFYAINAFSVQYAQEFRSYSLTVLISMLSTLFLVNMISNEESRLKWTVWYVITATAAVYTHMHALFLIAAQAVSLLILLINKKKYGRIILIYFLSCLGIGILLTPIAITTVQKGAILTWIAEPGFDTLTHFFTAISGYKLPILIVLFGLFGFIGILVGVRLRNEQVLIRSWKYTLLGLCFILPIAITYIISIAFTPIFSNRYLIYVMPFLIILASYGLVYLAKSIKGSKWVRCVFKMIMIISFGTITFFAVKGLFQYYEEFNKEEWRQASQLLTERCTGGYLIYYPEFLKVSVEYYGPVLPNHENLILNNLDRIDISNNVFPDSLFDGINQVCLVLSHNKKIQERVEATVIMRTVLKHYFSNAEKFKFFQIEIDIYSNQ